MLVLIPRKAYIPSIKHSTTLPFVDSAKYLLIRLSLRKQDKWHRLSSLKYQAEIGDKTSDAATELCNASCRSKPVVLPIVKKEVEDQTPYVKQEDLDVIDLTAHADFDIFPRKELPPVVKLEDEAIKSELDFREDLEPSPPDDDLNLDIFAEDESKMDLSELLACLTLEELRDVAKQLKLKTTGNNVRHVPPLPNSSC